MNARKMSLALVLAAAVVACDDATAPDPHSFTDAAGAPDGMVPFFARETAYTPADAVAVVCEPAWVGVALPNRLVATGVASHMGSVESVVAGEWCTVDLGTGVVSTAGTAVHTAAGGDVLYATWTGTIEGAALTLNVTFAGGTGRFAHATGQATGGGTLDAATGTGEWTMTGRISPPAP